MNKRYLIKKILVLLTAVIMAAVLFGCGGASQDLVREGVQYIREREAADIDEVEGRVNQVRQKLFLDELNEKLEADPDYVWTALDQIGTVLLGDSRIVPFATYGFMDESRVLADGGEALDSVEKHMEEIRTIHPSLVVIGHGMNDIANWNFETPEDYCEAVMGYVDRIQEMLPDASVYIQSILLPQEQIEEIYNVPGLYTRSREWDAAEQQYFKDHGYKVIDVSDLVVEHEDCFGEDGTHFYAPFYPYLAERYLKTYLTDTMEFDD